MTAHQAQLIDAEISRHISLALIAEEPEIRRDHLPWCWRGRGGQKSARAAYWRPLSVCAFGF